MLPPPHYLTPAMATMDYDEDSRDSMDSFYDFINDCLAQWGEVKSSYPPPALDENGAWKTDPEYLAFVRAFDSEEWEESEIEGEEEECEVEPGVCGFLTDLLK